MLSIIILLDISVRLIPPLIIIICLRLYHILYSYCGYRNFTHVFDNVLI